jgi:hypothetical protein
MDYQSIYLCEVVDAKASAPLRYMFLDHRCSSILEYLSYLPRWFELYGIILWQLIQIQEIPSCYKKVMIRHHIE